MSVVKAISPLPTESGARGSMACNTGLWRATIDRRSRVAADAERASAAQPEAKRNPRRLITGMNYLEGPPQCRVSCEEWRDQDIFVRTVKFRSAKCRTASGFVMRSRKNRDEIKVMDYSRRDLGVLLPVLFAADASAQPQMLPSKCYPFDSLPAKTNPQTHNETRQVLDGLTHLGYHIDLHITTLQPGQMPHPPHSHVHEEMVLMQEGTLEVTILGNSTRIGPGSVAYVKSNERHGWKNVGDGPARYFVMAFGQEKKA